MIFIFLGPPGSGKGTQAKRLAADIKLPHISTGDIIRDNIKRRTVHGLKSMIYTNEGKLVPDDLTCEILFDRISEDDAQNGYILDGFPRTILQAEKLDEKLNEQPVVINLEVPDDIIVKRLSGRLTCESCGQMYNRYFSPSQQDGVCDKCGGGLVHRDDDNENVIKERLQVYKTQTEPLIEYYSKRGSIHTIDGTRETNVIHKEVLKIAS